MTASIKVLSWNIRGLGNPVKRVAALRHFKAAKVDIICLQETHFPPGAIPSFGSQIYNTQIHATHSAYARGVSILIHRDVQFHCFQRVIDKEGKFIFLLCTVSNLTCIIANIYILPPYSAVTLRHLAKFMAQHPNVPLMAMGDFNNYLHHKWDKLAAPTSATACNKGPMPFARLLSELGLTDVWCRSHATVRQYSCCSTVYGSLSRIDLGLGNAALLPLVIDSGYGDRHISDHSSFWMSIALPVVARPRTWKLNPFWLDLFPTPDPIRERLVYFLKDNLGSTQLGIVWEAVKAFLRGQFITMINSIKSNTKAWETEVCKVLRDSEEAYISNPTEDTKKAC